MLRALIVEYRDNFFFHQGHLVGAMGVTSELTGVSNRLLFLRLYSSTSSIVNLFTSNQSIQIINCSM